MNQSRRRLLVLVALIAAIVGGAAGAGVVFVATRVAASSTEVAASPREHEKYIHANAIWVNAIYLVADDGSTRGSLVATPWGGDLQLSNSKGATCDLGFLGRAPSLYLQSQSGTSGGPGSHIRLAASTEKIGPHMALSDATGRDRISIGLLPEGAPAFQVRDADDRLRVSIGRTGLTTSLGDVQAPDDTIVSFREDGVVRWRTPEK